MKCKCGNEIKIRMVGKVQGDGCKILTAMTTVVTGSCNKCGEMFQAPISSDNVVVKDE